MFHVEQNQIHISVVDHFFSQEKFDIVKTKTTGLLQTHPAPPVKEMYKYYNSKKYISHNSKKTGVFYFLYRMFRDFNFWFKYRAISDKENCRDILDFGSGEEYFKERLEQKNHNVCGVDPFKTNRSKEIFESIFSKELDGKIFNCITAWHSLEHVHDLDMVISRFYQLLDDKGTVVVAVPNYRSLDAKYYKGFWAAYDAPRHLWHFDRQSIKQVFYKNGFNLVKSKPLFFDAYYVSLLSEKYRKSKLWLFNSLLLGTLSNINAIFTKQYSSNIFIFKKTKTST